MHGLDSGDNYSSAAKGIDSKHRSSDSVDGPVVLSDDVVEILVLAHQDVNAGIGFDACNGGRVGAAL